MSPLDGSEFWVVLDAELVAHQEASAFLRCLQGASRSPHTIRAYAGRTALFLGWCSGQGVDWRRVELAELARFKHWIEVVPARSGRVRSGSTVNAILTAVCELLRFCARTGLIEAVVAERLYGAVKAWDYLRRQGVVVARCTVERLCDTRSHVVSELVEEAG